MYDYNGVGVAHLGDLNHVPSQAEVEAMGAVHIALVPVGDGSSLNAAKAAEVISLIEPNIVIPMHFQTPACKIKLDPVNKFLKEMGLTEVETFPSFKVAGVSQFTGRVSRGDPGLPARIAGRPGPAVAYQGFETSTFQQG